MRSLASYAERKLEELRFRMLAVAEIASSWLIFTFILPDRQSNTGLPIEGFDDGILPVQRSSSFPFMFLIESLSDKISRMNREDY